MVAYIIYDLHFTVNTNKTEDYGDSDLFKNIMPNVKLTMELFKKSSNGNSHWFAAVTRRGNKKNRRLLWSSGN